MRTYANEWRFFEYLRKRLSVDKPYALEWGAWETWETDFKNNRPFVYFLTETLPDVIDSVTRHIPTPIDDIRYYCRNRFNRKSHVLPCYFKPGEYHDVDERILYGVMNALVNYVEIELAYKSRWVNTDESKKARWRRGRCPELGLAYLDWEMTLDNPELKESERSDSQAASAREVRAIYDWWHARENRSDPMDASGWSAICNESRARGMKFLEPGDEDYENRSKIALDKSFELERQYDQEDMDMLIRVMKIRRSLWT